MAVIPARPRRFGREAVPLRAAALDHWRSLLHRAVGLRRQMEPMPVDDILDVGVVGDVDVDLLAFAKAQNWSGHHTVVGESIDDLSGREFESQWRDAKCV